MFKEIHFVYGKLASVVTQYAFQYSLTVSVKCNSSQGLSSYCIIFINCGTKNNQRHCARESLGCGSRGRGLREPQETDAVHWSRDE